MTLAEKMTQPPRRDSVVSDCVTLIDEEVKGKGGLSGIAVKGAYSLVKAVKPRFVSEVVDAMLDAWVAKLSPFYDQWKEAGSASPLGGYLGGRSAEIAERLLEVTDAKAQRTSNGSIKKMYEKMRPTAKKHVEEAVPRLGRLVEKHAS